MNKTLKIPHDRSDFFSTKKYTDAVLQFFQTELQNDGDDITAKYFINKNTQSDAYIVAKEYGNVAGAEEGSLLLETFFPNIVYTWKKNDSEQIKKGETLVTFSGNARDILKVERVLLNLLSRMSGIATQTHQLVKKCTTQIAATRKTQWSYLDKKAVYMGGGATHRIGLFDAMMIKENHIIASTESIVDILSKLDNLHNNKNIGFLEIEVETREEFETVFNIFTKSDNSSLPKVIMFDNFSSQEISEIIQTLPAKNIRHQKNIFLEISGGITSDNIKQYDMCGADVISLGALTHTAVPLDYSLRFIDQ